MSAAPSPDPPRVPLAALDADYRERRPAIDAAALQVLASGRYILGPEVEAFEKDFARYLGVSSVVSCGNGTDAIALMLAAAGAGPEDEVLVPANVCVPVLAGVRLSGARARLADVDEATLTLDAASASKALTPRTRFLLPVHLYGGVADCGGLGRLASDRGLTLLEDCAQSHGAALGGRRTGSFGRAASFSFYPTKNLGAFGDGGAVATSDAELAGRVKRMRQYGWSRRDHADVEGRNSRLDELQAAILRVKLPSLEQANARRRAIAARYDEAFGGLPLTLLAGRPESLEARHLYVVRLERREDLRRHLAERGVETGIHYPLPLHLQSAYAFLGHRPGDFPVSEKASRTILSLPIHPALSDDQVGLVIAAVRSFYTAAP
jgi:dTDP-3-amino-3,4,6-trideoxy-alpha-D-glucose transaminase